MKKISCIISFVTLFLCNIYSESGYKSFRYTYANWLESALTNPLFRNRKFKLNPRYNAFDENLLLVERLLEDGEFLASSSFLKKSIFIIRDIENQFRQVYNWQTDAYTGKLITSLKTHQEELDWYELQLHYIEYFIQHEYWCFLSGDLDSSRLMIKNIQKHWKNLHKTNETAEAFYDNDLILYIQYLSKESKLFKHLAKEKVYISTAKYYSENIKDILELPDNFWNEKLSKRVLILLTVYGYSDKAKFLYEHIIANHDSGLNFGLKSRINILLGDFEPAIKGYLQQISQLDINHPLQWKQYVDVNLELINVFILNNQYQSALKQIHQVLQELKLYEKSTPLNRGDKDWYNKHIEKLQIHRLALCNKKKTSLEFNNQIKESLANNTLNASLIILADKCAIQTIDNSTIVKRLESTDLKITQIDRFLLAYHLKLKKYISDDQVTTMLQNTNKNDFLYTTLTSSLSNTNNTIQQLFKMIRFDSKLYRKFYIVNENTDLFTNYILNNLAKTKTISSKQISMLLELLTIFEYSTSFLKAPLKKMNKKFYLLRYLALVNLKIMKPLLKVPSNTNNTSSEFVNIKKKNSKANKRSLVVIYPTNDLIFMRRYDENEEKSLLLSKKKKIWLSEVSQIYKAEEIKKVYQANITTLKKIASFISKVKSETINLLLYKEANLIPYEIIPIVQDKLLSDSKMIIRRYNNSIRLRKLPTNRNKKSEILSFVAIGLKQNGFIFNLGASVDELEDLTGLFNNASIIRESHGIINSMVNSLEATSKNILHIASGWTSFATENIKIKFTNKETSMTLKDFDNAENLNNVTLSNQNIFKVTSRHPWFWNSMLYKFQQMGVKFVISSQIETKKSFRAAFFYDFYFQLVRKHKSGGVSFRHAFMRMKKAFPKHVWPYLMVFYGENEL